MAWANYEDLRRDRAVFSATSSHNEARSSGWPSATAPFESSRSSDLRQLFHDSRIAGGRRTHLHGGRDPPRRRGDLRGCLAHPVRIRPVSRRSHADAGRTALRSDWHDAGRLPRPVDSRMVRGLLVPDRHHGESPGRSHPLRLRGRRKAATWRLPCGGCCLPASSRQKLARRASGDSGSIRQRERSAGGRASRVRRHGPNAAARVRISRDDDDPCRPGPLNSLRQRGRHSTRSRRGAAEIAMRLALGAGRGRLVRQLPPRIWFLSFWPAPGGDLLATVLTRLFPVVTSSSPLAATSIFTRMGECSSTRWA